MGDPETRTVFTFIVGGQAGAGVKKTGAVAARLFADRGRYLFQMDDYQSLIRGGHNFCAVSTALRPVTSQYLSADVVVALDQRSMTIHRDHVRPGGVFVYDADAVTNDDEGEETGTDPDTDIERLGVPLSSTARQYPNPDLRLGIGALAALAAAIELPFTELGALLASEYPRDEAINAEYARTIYDLVDEGLERRFTLDRGDRAVGRPIMTGNEAIALGAIAAGLDLYFGYPMTPASAILHLIAKHGPAFGARAVHLENELSVMNMALGAAAAGARSMIGSSGGGFALMQEGFSLAGMAEVPILCIMGSRSGPATGVPTYTEQGDLRFALNQGHGDFPRIVASPASVEDAFVLAGELLELAWQFQVPTVLLTEKHLAESQMAVDLPLERVGWAETGRAGTGTGTEHGPTIEPGAYQRYRDTPSGVSPMRFPPAPGELIKWNSYEHDEVGITTEAAPLVAQMHEKRERKAHAIRDELAKRETVRVYGADDDDDGGDGTAPVIVTYGSTTLSVLEALRAGGMETSVTVVQPVYLEPFPTDAVRSAVAGRPVAVVEQSCSGQFARLIAEKARIDAVETVRRYDGRPFDPDDLAAELRGVIE